MLVQGARKIDYAQFVKALELAAEKKGVSLEDVVAKAVAAGGPTSSGTVRHQTPPLFEIWTTWVLGFKSEGS
jgi:hypothetical protein